MWLCFIVPIDVMANYAEEFPTDLVVEVAIFYMKWTRKLFVLEEFPERQVTKMNLIPFMEDRTEYGFQ